MRIGILALQGDFAEHSVMLRRLGVTVTEVRLPQQLEGLSGLIIPGGESTTIAKLAVSYGLMEPLYKFGQNNAIWGTCAGAIFMSKDAHRDQPLLQLMDITVERNAFGRQVDSFEVDLDIPALLEVDPEAKTLPRSFHSRPSHRIRPRRCMHIGSTFRWTDCGSPTGTHVSDSISPRADP